MKISYYAHFDYADDGINVTFPDIPNALTCGFTKRHAKKMAGDVLSLVLHGLKLIDLPPATEPANRKCFGNHSFVKIQVRMKVKNGILIGKNVIELQSKNKNYTQKSCKLF